MRPGVVDRAQPRGEQAVELFQAGDRVPGRAPAVRVAGDLGQELLLDHPENAFYFSPPHRAPGLAAGQPDAEYRAGPLQRRIDKRRPVVAVQTGRDAAGGDRGAEHAGEPDGVGAADEPGPGQEPGPVIDDARQKGRLPADPRAVHEVRGPDLVHRIGLEPAERLRRRPARPGGQLPGLQPSLDGPQRRDGAALRGQDPADLRRGPGRVLHLQPGRELLGVRPEPGRALPRRRHQPPEPLLTAGDDPPVQRPPRHADLLPVPARVLPRRPGPHHQPPLAGPPGRIPPPPPHGPPPPPRPPPPRPPAAPPPAPPPPAAGHPPPPPPAAAAPPAAPAALNPARRPAPATTWPSTPAPAAGGPEPAATAGLPPGP